MRALIEKTDSFNGKTRFWICGKDKTSCWRQMDDLQDMSSSCRLGCYYNIVAWDMEGKITDALTGEIITRTHF